jgi:hypothetical protein
MWSHLSAARPPPNTYYSMQEENLGSARKFIENYSFCVLPTKFTRGVWAGGTLYSAENGTVPTDSVKYS